MTSYYLSCLGRKGRKGELTAGICEKNPRLYRLDTSAITTGTVFRLLSRRGAKRRTGNAEVTSADLRRAARADTCKYFGYTPEVENVYTSTNWRIPVES